MGRAAAELLRLLRPLTFKGGGWGWVRNQNIDFDYAERNGLISEIDDIETEVWNMTKIKICGLSRDMDAEFVNEARPDYAGFIIGVPKSRRNISEDRAARLRELIDDSVITVGVFIDYPAERVAALLNSGVINAAQLHGSEDDSYIARLRELAPDKAIWKAFVIKSKDDAARAQLSTADMVLLDSGTGSGKSFDWTAAADMEREFILAGGLTPENIGRAIEQVDPYAVDISSGVETDGVKDREKIIAATNAARNHK